MKITELDFTDGKKYIDGNDNVWKVRYGNLYNDDSYTYITNAYTLREISSIDFKEYTDWNKVAVDAKVVYINNKGIEYRGHFAEVINGTVYVWRNGGTSFTKRGKESVRGARLYMEDNKYEER